MDVPVPYFTICVRVPPDLILRIDRVSAEELGQWLTRQLPSSQSAGYCPVAIEQFYQWP